MTFPGSRIYDFAKEKGIVADEVAYLNQPYGQHILNLTDLSGEEFALMKNTVIEYGDVSRFSPGILKKHHFNGDGTAGIEVFCPHCRHLNQYQTVLIDDRDERLLFTCPACERPYMLPNLGIWEKAPRLPRRLFMTNYPPHRLFELYLKRGGSLEELEGYQ